MLGEEKVYHKIEVHCAKSSINLESCGPGEYLCDDRKQCIPSYWVCDGIEDCSDASDECPVINKNVKVYFYYIFVLKCLYLLFNILTIDKYRQRHKVQPEVDGGGQCPHHPRPVL